MGNLEQLRRFSDSIASHYHQEEIAAGLVTNTVVAQAVGEHVKRGIADLHYLDLGAGTGRTIEAVAAVLPFSRIVAVDFSDPMLSQLPGNMPEGMAVETVTSEIGDYLASATEQACSFDVITMVSVVDHYSPQDTERLIRGAAGLLRLGGVLAFPYAPYIKHHPRLGRESWTFTHESSGLDVTGYSRSSASVRHALETSNLSVVEQTPFCVAPQVDASRIAELVVAKRSERPHLTSSALRPAGVTMIN